MKLNYTIDYIGPGDKLRIASDPASDVFIEAGTLEGFRGQFEDSGQQAIGVPGQVIDIRDRVTQPMEGSFTLVVWDPEIWPKVRAAFSSRDVGELVLKGPVRELYLPVRLAESLPSPDTHPERGSRIEVRLISDGGVWLEPVVDPGPRVVITNAGEVPVWTKIDWDGAGGQVVMPSGAQFTLPRVNGVHSLMLDRRHAGEVYLPDGSYSNTLSRQIGAVAEMVPVGAEAEMLIPPDAQVAYSLGVYDPWI